MNKDLIRQVRLRLDQAEHILITSHTRPDGDAIGSILALGQALSAIGKEVEMVSADGVPAALKFLPGSDRIKNRSDEHADLVIVVDSSNLDRVGDVLDSYDHIDLNIDHHPDNTHFATINLVQSKAVSTTEILSKLISELELEITTEIASNLLTGLITDTIGFKTGNMHPQALRIAADLVEKGADLASLYHHAIVEKTFEAARYMGAGLSQLMQDNGLVWTSLTLENRRQADYPGRDDADLVNMLSAIKSAVVAVIFIEQTDGSVKVSWRTRSKAINVASIAQQFEGGGHRAAAGAMISGSLQEVQTMVLKATKPLLEK
jgi:phosphoesterase RecJ-like protein